MRYRSLDGLRGVAALVVLIHHALLTLPAFSEAFWQRAHLEGALALLDGTPFHIIWAGPEAVYVFFVLSGLVLALAAKSPRFEWMPYYPSRMVRLYLPVVAAVVLCTPLLIWAAPISSGASIWVQAHQAPYGPGPMLVDMTLVGGISGGITPLWSLQWEVLFSLLLPVYLLAVRRRQLWWEVPGLVLVSAVGAFASVPVLRFLPMFALGVALAEIWGWLERRLSGPVTWRSTVVWALALCGAVVLLTSTWIFWGLGIDFPETLLLPFKLMGVIVIVIGAAFAPGLRTILASPVGVFLGAVSFSLYLLHEPILMFFARLIPDPGVALLISVPIVAVVTIVFWLLVERRAHTLAQSLRTRLTTGAVVPAPEVS